MKMAFIMVQCQNIGYVSSALRKLRQKDFCEFKSTQGYIDCFPPPKATYQDCVSNFFQLNSKSVD